MSKYEIARIKFEVAATNFVGFAEACTGAETLTDEDRLARDRLISTVAAYRKKAAKSPIPAVKSFSRLLKGVVE